MSALSASELEETFRNPPEAAKPWCYWYWLLLLRHHHIPDRLLLLDGSVVEHHRHEHLGVSDLRVCGVENSGAAGQVLVSRITHVGRLH